MGPAPLAAIIEVISDPDGSLPVELIRKAYRASRAGHVVLVLNGVPAPAIDRILDDVVAYAGKVHGVLYADVKNASVWVSRLAVPEFALVSTEPLRALLAARHARMLPASDAVQVLETLSARIGNDATAEVETLASG
jgi:hypothetical protein